MTIISFGESRDPCSVRAEMCGICMAMARKEKWRSEPAGVPSRSANGKIIAEMGFI